MKLFHHRPIYALLACLLALPAMNPPALTAVPPTLTRDMEQHAAATRPPARRMKKKPARPTAPTVVQDVRVFPYPDHTRLVLDLQRSVTFTQNRQKRPDRVIIELHNSLLGKTALAKLGHEDFPNDVVITNRATPRSVTIALDLDTISDYKLLPLNRPTRLVVDVFTRQPREEPAAVAPPPPVLQAPVPKARPRGARTEIGTIVLDAGHGGKDPGAIGRGGAAEKDITLQVSLRLRDLIVKHLGKRVLLTRDRDVFVELEDRAKFANSHEADLFVSVHVNSHPHRATKGMEVYHFGEASDPRALAVAARENGTPIEDTGVGWQYLVADLLTTKKAEESLEFAWTTKQAMVSHLDTHYDIVDHGVKTGPFYVLRFTSMPSILAEIAFISNPTEERLMQGNAFLTRIAEALFQGIKAFVNPPQVASEGVQG